MNIADMPASQVTAGQLVDLIIQRLNVPNQERPQYSRGLKCLVDRFGVSLSTIMRLKNNGVFGDAIKQRGKVILVDLDKAEEYYFDKSRRKNCKR